MVIHLNPAMLSQYLNLFRATHNYCNAGKDGITAAVRLGLSDRIMTYDGVLWPGQVPPQAPVKKEVEYSPLDTITYNKVTTRNKPKMRM